MRVEAVNDRLLHKSPFRRLESSLRSNHVKRFPDPDHFRGQRFELVLQFIAACSQSRKNFLSLCQFCIKLFEFQLKGINFRLSVLEFLKKGLCCCRGRLIPDLKIVVGSRNVTLSPFHPDLTALQVKCQSGFLNVAQCDLVGNATVFELSGDFVAGNLKALNLTFVRSTSLCGIVCTDGSFKGTGLIPFPEEGLDFEKRRLISSPFVVVVTGQHRARRRRERDDGKQKDDMHRLQISNCLVSCRHSVAT